jgi:Fe-S-cluster containining protein
MGVSLAVLNMTMPVPCDGCTACCRDGMLVYIDPEDDPMAEYETTMEPSGRAHLKHRPNGDCLYLDRKRGCTIHDRRPLMCRAYDCRDALRLMRSAGLSDLTILAAEHMSRDIYDAATRLMRRAKARRSARGAVR